MILAFKEFLVESSCPIFIVACSIAQSNRKRHFRWGLLLCKYFEGLFSYISNKVIYIISFQMLIKPKTDLFTTKSCQTHWSRTTQFTWYFFTQLFIYIQIISTRTLLFVHIVMISDKHLKFMCDFFFKLEIQIL